MPAPSNTTWGIVEGGYGKLGISATVTKAATSATLKVQIWFWSKYSCSDSSNTLYYNNTTSNSSQADVSLGSVPVDTGVQSGEGWSTSNQQLLKELTNTYTRSTTAQTRYLVAKLTNIDRVGADVGVKVSATIPALDRYTVTYNANGGSGAPSSQTKYYGQTLKLSSTKPTRSGYIFWGWATSATSGTAEYAAGANYTANESVTLYAVWSGVNYTVQYDANGGTGAPSTQYKTHDKTLKLSSTQPTRTNYAFKGWGTSAAATTVAYAAGANYTANAAVTLYAIWESSYIKPKIYNFSVDRCDADGTLNDSGEYVLVKYDWETTEADPYMEINISGPGGLEDNIAGSGTSGSWNMIYGPVDTESSYDITVLVEDSNGDSTATRSLASMTFPFDVKSGGKGVSFGKAAELDGVAEFAFEGKFNKPVYGKALGMDRLPAIPNGSDFNDYIEPGCYAVQRNDTSSTIENIPVARAGRLEVWAATGEGVRSEQWSYLRQRYIPYNSGNAVWEREVTRGEDNVWLFYEWWKSSLTPAASEKVYSKAAMTISLSATTTIGAVNTYSKIPLDKVVLSTSDRLTLQENSIRIGANIEYVKVSGQALIGIGNTDGLRHVRIRKVSSTGTITNVSWVTAYGMASRQTVYPLAPAIVAVEEGDLLNMVFYTANSADSNSAGSSGNGWQTYMTVEEL